LCSAGRKLFLPCTYCLIGLHYIDLFRTCCTYPSSLIECVVTRLFTAHCSAFNLLPTHQSAYRPFHSTETALLSVHNNLVRSTDNGHVSLLVLLDLSAAFDTVDHQIRLSVLSNRFLVDSTALKSYLTDQTQLGLCSRGSQALRYSVDCSVPLVPPSAHSALFLASKMSLT